MSIFSRRYRGATAEPLPTEPIKPVGPQVFEHQGQATTVLTPSQIEDRSQVIDQQQQAFAATPKAMATQQLQAGKERYREEQQPMLQGGQQGAIIPPGQQGVTTPIQDEIESKLAARDAGTLKDTSDEQPYLADWSNGFDKGLHWLWSENGQKAKPTEVIQDYNRWAKENGQDPLDAFTMYPFLTQYDPTKSIGETEAEERRRKSQEKWEQIGNVLSHVGNFIGTAIGAPNQQLETGAQLTERQRKLRDATLAQRRQSALDMLQQLNKDRADARAAELNAANINYRNNAIKMAQNKDARDAELARLNGEVLRARAAGEEGRAKKLEAEIDRLKQLIPVEVEEKKASAEQKRASAASSYASADASHARAENTRQGTRSNNDDEFDRLYNDPEYRPYFDVWAKNNDLAVGGNKKGKGGNWSKKDNRAKSVSWAKDKHRRDKQNKQNNTPPSRKRQNQDNTPPSRRKR